MLLIEDAGVGSKADARNVFNITGNIDMVQEYVYTCERYIYLAAHFLNFAPLVVQASFILFVVILTTNSFQTI